RGRAARRAAAAHPRRARERARPRRGALAAHFPPEPRRRRTHRPRLEPPARRGRPDRRPGVDHRPRPASRPGDTREADRRRADARGRLPRAHWKRHSMNGQLRSELLKQRSTQTPLFLFLAMVGLVALAVALHVLAISKPHLSSNAQQLEVFQVGTRAGMLFAALAGALAITAEIRYGTIRPTFLV